MKKNRIQIKLKILFFILFFTQMFSCKSYSQDFIPYVLDGEFVMEDGAAEYSICGAEFFLLNKSNSEIKKINIIFYLFDKDGEPASGCKNKISLDIEQVVGSGEESSFCISLDKYMNSIPEEKLLLDYLYLAKIEYEDGNVWEDPFGLVAFK